MPNTQPTRTDLSPTQAASPLASPYQTGFAVGLRTKLGRPPLGRELRAAPNDPAGFAAWLAGFRAGQAKVAANEA